MMRFYTKIDLWVGALLAFSFLLPLAITFQLIRERASSTDIFITLLSALAVPVLMALIALPTYYEITSSSLLIRSGLFRTEIPIAQIIKVQPSRNPLSAPAWSLDRVRINYRNEGGREWFALISPKDKQQFMRALMERDSALVSVDNGLSRRARNR